REGERVGWVYWASRVSAIGREPVSAEAGRRKVRELLEESTALHLVSDVPVGVFLSGGIDSGAIASLVRQAGVVPQTFSVAFTGTEYDESPFARAMADSLQTKHTEISLA